MNIKNACPCCSNKMLRHLSNRHSYWYCSSCRIEMPNIEPKKAINNKVKVQSFPERIKSAVSKSQSVKTIVNL